MIHSSLGGIFILVTLKGYVKRKNWMSFHRIEMLADDLGTGAIILNHII